ncbi:UNVERIFIED_ORG: hypothetical protein GGD48_000873 [Rhizobium etli]
MTWAWCVSADWGTYPAPFRQGGFVALGWNDLGHLSRVTPSHVMAR